MSDIKWSVIPVTVNGKTELHVLRKSGRQRQLKWLTKGVSTTKKNKPLFGPVRDFDNAVGPKDELLWLIENPIAGRGSLVLDRIEPHLMKPTMFSKILMEYKNNFTCDQLTKLLSIITKSKDFSFHDEGFNEDGTEIGESVVKLDSHEKIEVNRIIMAATHSAIKVDNLETLNQLPDTLNKKANEKKGNTENIAPIPENESANPMKRSNDGSIRKGKDKKKVVMEQNIAQQLKSTSGLEQNMMKHESFFRDVPLKNIFPHPDLEKDKNHNESRVVNLQKSMNLTFDATLSVLTLIPRLEPDEKMNRNPQSYWAVTGLLRLEALSRVKDQEDKIHCLVILARGTIQANYLHSRNNYLSHSIAPKPGTMQDYLKLFNSIKESVQNATTAIKILHSIMLVQRQDSDTMTNMKKICREFTELNFQLLIQAAKSYENFDTKDSENPNQHVKKHMHNGLPLPLTKDMIKNISICPQSDATQLLTDIIEKRKSFRDVGVTIKNIMRLKDVEAQVVDMIDEAKDIEEVRKMFPNSFSQAELLGKYSHSKKTKDGGKNEQRHMLELKVNSVVNHESNKDNIEYNVYENIEHDLRKAVEECDVIILSQAIFRLDLVKKCLTCAQNVPRDHVAIILLLDSSSEEFKVLKYYSQIPAHASFEIFKTSSLKTGPPKKTSNSIENLDTIYVIGRFNFKKPISTFNGVPIKSVLKDVVGMVTRPGGKVANFGVDVMPVKVQDKDSDYSTSYISTSSMIDKFRATQGTHVVKESCIKEKMPSRNDLNKNGIDANDNTTKAMAQEERETLINANEMIDNDYDGVMNGKKRDTEEQAGKGMENHGGTCSSNSEETELYSEIKIEDIEDEMEFNLDAMVISTFVSKERFVLRLTDGTISKINSLKVNSSEGEEQSDFIDIFSENLVVNEMVKSGEIVNGSFIRLIGIHCKLYRKLDSQGNSFDFLVEDSEGEHVVKGFEFILGDEERFGDVIEVLRMDDISVTKIKERVDNTKDGPSFSGIKEDPSFNNSGQSQESVSLSISLLQNPSQET